jgi:hypothetical protein
VECAVCFAVAHVCRRDPFNEVGQRFDVCQNSDLDERMPRVVRLQLVALLEWAALLSCVNFYRDASNLTRLDDFVEVKV